MLSTRLLAVAIFALVFSIAGTGCKKDIKRPEFFMEANMGNSKFSVDYCQLYQDKNRWVLDGYNLKYTASDPKTYPMLCIYFYGYFDTAFRSYVLGVDSVSAIYFRSVTDSVNATSGTISVRKAGTDPCSGSYGTFVLTLKDSTIMTNGRYQTTPICGYH